MGALSTHYASIHISACTAQRIFVWLWKYGLLSPLCVINKNKKSEGRWLLILRHSNVLTCVHHVKMLDHLGICTIFLIILKIRTYPKHSGPLLVVKIWKRSKNALPHLRPKTTCKKTNNFCKNDAIHSIISRSSSAQINWFFLTSWDTDQSRDWYPHRAKLSHLV